MPARARRGPRSVPGAAPSSSWRSRSSERRKSRVATSPIAERNARALFDLCAGFVYSQILFACVQLDLFRLLADGIPGAKEEMGFWSLAAVGATLSGRPGFILLADRAELTAGGHAEDLQDHACEIAKPKS